MGCSWTVPVSARSSCHGPPALVNERLGVGPRESQCSAATKRSGLLREAKWGEGRRMSWEGHHQKNKRRVYTVHMLYFSKNQEILTQLSYSLQMIYRSAWSVLVCLSMSTIDYRLLTPAMQLLANYEAFSGMSFPHASISGGHGVFR